MLLYKFKINMTCIRKFNNHLVISSLETLIIVDVDTNNESTLEIPEPVPVPNPTKDQQVLKKQGRKVISCEHSMHGDYIALSLENKQVVVLDKKFRVFRNFIIPRVASKVCFSPTNDLVVADKTGDVYIYFLLDENKQSILILGHLSMILDITFSTCGKYIITCDRDEKIRVSHFPNAYNIASFCLGHTQFVSRVVAYRDVLLSASGDGTMKVWNFIKGEELSTIHTKDFINAEELIDSFSKEMDNEKIDVDTLPITDMQVSAQNDKAYIAISLYKYAFIQIYLLQESYKISYLSKIAVDFTCDYYFDEYLYVLCRSQFKCYKVTASDCEVVSTNLSDIIDKYKNVINMSTGNDILNFYKRKYDNVQEYMEKKKARINSK